MYSKVNASRALQEDGGIDKGYQIIGNLMYDVNPAVRFSLEWDYSNVHYTPASPIFHSDGTQNVYRLAAYYFF
jgi:hypothetical protein